MSGQRWIGHLDIDAFFAQASLLDRPDLQRRPVVVSGDGPRAVVATANYPARKLGIRSAQPLWKARQRYPNLTVVKPDFVLYRALSAQVMACVAAISDVYERVSIDETYFEPAPDRAGSMSAVLAELQQTILERTRLTVSVGAASSRTAAKLASEHNKPNGVHVCDPDHELAFVQSHPAAALPGWGPATARKAERLHIVTIGDIANVNFADLARLVGDSHARSLQAGARNERSGALSFAQARLSVTHEVTFDDNLDLPQAIREQAFAIAEHALARLRNEQAAAGTVAVKMRTADWAEHSRQTTLPHPTSNPGTLLGAVEQLTETMLAGVREHGVRLVGVSFSGLDHGEQLSLLEPAVEYTGPKPVGAGAVVEHDQYGTGLVYDRYDDSLVVRFPARTAVIDAARCTPTGRRVDRWSDLAGRSSENNETLLPEP